MCRLLLTRLCKYTNTQQMTGVKMEKEQNLGLIPFRVANNENPVLSTHVFPSVIPSFVMLCGDHLLIKQCFEPCDIFPWVFYNWITPCYTYWFNIQWDGTVFH